MSAQGRALSYAARGLPVFPCRPRGKKPATSHGLKDATTDAEHIRAWWEEDPRFNIGLVTGPESGLLVLDLDGDPRVLLGGRPVPRTPVQRTGGGGYQVFFRWPSSLDEAATTRTGLLPNVDTRGRGGYVIVPESIHPSGPAYRWCRGAGLDDRPLADPPEWLVGLLRPPEAERPVRASAPAPVATSERYVRVAIERECLELARMPKGVRNDALNRSSYSLARFVAEGQADAEGVARALSVAAASAGLGAREIARTIESAFRARGVTV